MCDGAICGWFAFDFITLENQDMREKRELKTSLFQKSLMNLKKLFQKSLVDYMASVYRNLALEEHALFPRISVGVNCYC